MFFVRATFFENHDALPTAHEIEEAFRLFRRMILRSHLMAQGFGAPAGLRGRRIDRLGRLIGPAEPNVLSVEMRSPLTIVAELPAVLQYASGAGALLLLAERVSVFLPRVQAKWSEFEAIRAVAKARKANADAYVRGLQEGSIKPDRIDLLRDLDAPGIDLDTLDEPQEGGAG